MVSKTKKRGLSQLEKESKKKNDFFEIPMENQQRKKQFVLFFITIFIILLAISLLALSWHSMPIKNPQFSLTLESYDSVVTTEDVCFKVFFDSENLDEKREDLLIKVNDAIVFTEEFDISKKSSKEFCLENKFFSEIDNIVELDTFSRSIFFHVGRIDSYKLIEQQIRIISFEKVDDYSAKLSFEITNKLEEKEPVYIYLNDSLVRRAFFEDGNHEELISIVEGTNKIKTSFYGGEETTLLENIVSLKSNLIIGLLIIAFLLFVLITCVFSNKEFLENIVSSILTFLTILIIVGFILNYSGLLSSISFSVFTFFISLVLLMVFKGRMKLPRISFNLKDHFTLFLLIFFLIVLLFNIVTPTNVSFWTSFYERQSETVFENNGVPLLDSFTHFGEKPYGYLSAYFFAESGISFLFGDFNEISFAILLVLANLALFFSAMIFFEKIGLTKTKAKLVVMLMLIGGFLLGDVFFNERHIIALALMFVSLTMLVDKKKLAIIPAGIAMWFQLPIIITIILVSFVLTQTKIKFKPLLKYWIGTAIIGLIFYIPTFLLYGLPTQAKPTTWGYLFGMPWYGVIVDLLAQIIFFFVIMLPITGFKPRVNSFTKKVLILLAILILVQLFITYRVNIATTIIFSFIGVYLFPSNFLRKKEIKHLIFIIFVIGALFASSVLLNYVVPDFAISSADDLALMSSSEAHILNAPALGHYTAYFSQRKILADLAVEYADAGKIDDAFFFFEKEDQNILKKYDIDFVYNQKFLIETQPVGSVERKEPIEFTFLNKVYDNGVFFIHSVR